MLAESEVVPPKQLADLSGEANQLVAILTTIVWHWDEVCALNQHIVRVVPLYADKGELYWALMTVTAHLEDQAHGIIGMVHITKTDLGAINIPAPSPPNKPPSLPSSTGRRRRPMGWWRSGG